MVAIVAGAGFGLGQTSSRTLGSQGLWGNPSVGLLGSNFLVNATSGNVIIQQQDEVLTGAGHDIILSRTYNSLGRFNDDNGDNWRQSSQRSVSGLKGTINTAGSTIRRIDWDGSEQVFSYDAGKAAYIFKDPAGSIDRITFASDRWTWTDGDSRVSELYDNLNGGRIVASTDADGQAIQFTYTGKNLTRITDANGEYMALSYTGSNMTQIATYSSANVIIGTRVRYTYDASNRLSTVTVDLSPTDNVVSDDKVVTYRYTYDGASKRVASIAETGSNALVAFLYDAATGKVIRVTETAASGDVRVTNFDYSVAKRTRVIDTLNNITDYISDDSGRIASIVYPPAVSGAAWGGAATRQTVTYAWDAASGHIASITDPLGRVTRYTYDANGNRTRDRDAAGNVIDRTFDARTNALLTETHYREPDPDGAGTGVPSNPVTTRYVYDKRNHLRFIISPEGNVTEYRYNTIAGSTWRLLNTFRYTANSYDVTLLSDRVAPDEAKIVAWVTALADRRTVERTDMVYDFRGNLSTITTYSATDSAGTGLTTSPYTVTNYVYDQFGLLLSRQVSGRTGTEVFTYDGLGRMLTSTDFAGNETKVAINDATRQTVTTLANGEQKTATYNAFGQQLTSKASGAGATSQVVSYKYDALGRLRASVDQLNARDYVFYDAGGRKTGYMDRRGYLTEYRYNAANQLIATIEYTNAITAAALGTLFDAKGNALNVAFSAVRPLAAEADLWSWNVYDAAGRLTETVASNGAVVKFAYDGIGQLVSKTEYINLLSAATVAGFRSTLPTALTVPSSNTNDRVTRFFHDSAGLQIGTLDADGALTQIKYDKAGRAIETLQYASLTTAELRAAGSWASLLASVTASPSSADRRQAIVYDGQGRIRYTLDANARPTEFIYNNAGGVVRTISYGSPITAANSYALGYVQSQIKALGLAASESTRTTRIIYDSAGRKAFDIDAAGDVTAYNYNSLGYVVKQTRYNALFTDTGDQSIKAMQSWVKTNANTAYDRVNRAVFDGLGRLVYEIDAGGYVTEHQYDVKNRIVKDIRYSATYIVADNVTQSSLKTQIGAISANAVVTQYAYDAVGNVTDVTDAMGIVTHYDFDPFGRNITITNKNSGSMTRMTYDALGRIVEKTTGVTSTNTNSKATVKFTYDGVGNIASSTDAMGATILYTYDTSGNQLTVKIPLSDTSSVYATTTRVYDAFGNVVKTISPLGFSTFFYYNKLDQLQYQVDAEGYATETSYTIGGAVESVRRMAVKPSGAGSVTTLPTFSYDKSDAVTSFTRDKLDRVISVKDAEGFHEDYVLNAFGDRTRVINKLGGRTFNDYDKLGRLTKETLPVGSTRPDGTGQSTVISNKFAYDANGNRTKMIEAFGLAEQRTTTYAYDRNNRLISKTGDPVLSTNPSDLSGILITPVETYVYDANGNLIEVKDAAGARTLSYYDAGNRRIAQLSPVGTLSTWTYDANGNVLSARIYGNALALPATSYRATPVPIDAANYRETSFTYDRNNRLLKTSVAGVTTGSMKAGKYVTSSKAITVTNVYDAAGNVIQQTDGNGGTIFSYFNKLGQKTAQVDQGGYLTSWTRDEDGNVTRETRYASQYTGKALTAGGTPPSVARDDINDRTTTFTYDKNGRRLTQSRLNVQASTVSGNGLVTGSVTATITYAYNGLGLVTSRREATGDVTSYGYDRMGRQTSMTGPAFTDYSGATVSNTQLTSYDGLNNATRTVDNGTRVTTFTYGAGGRLASSVDPAGNRRDYYYDVMGRLTGTSGYLLKSDGNGVWQSQSIHYDIAGRQVAQKVLAYSGSTWAQVGDTTENFYNCYGEVVARGTNSGGTIANAQEFAEYDKAGRVWRTNLNDGITKAYMYDANGNATLLLQTKGSVDLGSASFKSASSMFADAGIAKTFSIYDARNQLIDTIQVSSRNAGAPPIHAQKDASSTDGVIYFNSDVSVDPSASAPTGTGAYIIDSQAHVSASQAGYTNISTYVDGNTIKSIRVESINPLNNGGQSIHVILEGNQRQWFAADKSGGGGGNIQRPINPEFFGEWRTTEYSREIAVYSSNQNAYNIGLNTQLGYNYSRISVYQDAPGGGRILLAQTQVSCSNGTQVGGSLSGQQWTPATLQFQNENPSTSVIRLLGRPSGSTGPYQYVGTAAQMTRQDGSAIAGWFNCDISGLMSSNWDLKYFAYDASGNIVDVRNAGFAPTNGIMIHPNAIQMTQRNNQDHVSFSSVTGILDIDFIEERNFRNTSESRYIDIMTRPSGSGQDFVFQSRSSTSGRFIKIPGEIPWFIGDASFNLSTMKLEGPLGIQSFDVKFVYRDNKLDVQGISQGIFTGNIYGKAGYWDTPAPAYGPGQAMLTREGATDYLILSGIPSTTASLFMHYRPIGSLTWSGLNIDSGGYGVNGLWSIGVTGLSGPYEYWIEPRDGAGTLLGGKSYGTFTVGGQPSELTQYYDRPTTVTFQPPAGETVNFQRFRYFSNGIWSDWINYGASGNWDYDASALVPDRFESYGYTFEYETYSGTDANSAIVSKANGSMQLGYGTQSVSYTPSSNLPAKVVFDPEQTAGTELRLYWRDKGKTGPFKMVKLPKVNGRYVWDVSESGARLIPKSEGNRQIEYYYDQYDSRGKQLPTLVGSEHVQGTLTFYNKGQRGNGYSSSTQQNEIRWILDTAPLSSFLIHRKQSHNAFGEISSETDGRGNVTSFFYNTMGKLIRKLDPLVDVTDEAGVTTRARPDTNYYYDKSGRTVGVRDANGNLTTQTLLAGSGYGDGKALATAEYRVGSTNTYGYDVFGDLRRVTDGLGAVTSNVYDANHNLIQVDHAKRVGGNSNGVQLKDYYAYDALGRRIRHWTSQFGSAVVETTDYDAMGRVTSTRSFGGQTVNYSYVWYGKNNIWTQGMGAFGGWQTITTTSAGVTQHENDDLFGRVVWRLDYGGHEYGYSYDLAGHLKGQTNTAGQNISYAYYDNGYIRSVTDNARHMKSTFEYDNDGNRTLETYNSTDASPIFYQNAVISYDALNRIVEFKDAKAVITYKYDANSNRRNVKSVYQDGVGGSGQVQDFWYRYDAQNRFVLTMGALTGGRIVAGRDGVSIEYDAAGNRAAATYGYDGHKESYSYTADGYLEDMSVNGVRRSSRTSDALGRVTRYMEYAANGTVGLDRRSAYDDDNRITTTNTVDTDSTTTQTYDYRLWNGSAYAGADQGVVTHVRTVEGRITTETGYSYVWWDEAKQSSITINATNPSNPNTGRWAPGFSRLSYDVNGHIATLTDAAADRVVRFASDAYGQVLVREERLKGVLGPRQLHYYFNGQRIGDVGNNGRSANLTDYAAQMAASGKGAGATRGGFRFGRPVASADFDQNYQPVNAGYPGPAATAYTVRSGDTLSTIARAVWGDGAMWYLIAEANGLSAGSTLTAGQRLIIPNRVTNVHNNAGTLRVYAFSRRFIAALFRRLRNYAIYLDIRFANASGHGGRQWTAIGH